MIRRRIPRDLTVGNDLTVGDDLTVTDDLQTADLIVTGTSDLRGAVSSTTSDFTINDDESNARAVFARDSHSTFKADVADSGSNTAFRFGNVTTLTSGRRIAEFHNDTTMTTPEVYISQDGSVVPGTTATASLGASSLGFVSAYLTTGLVNAADGNTRLSVADGAQSQYQGDVANSSTNCAHRFTNVTSLSGSTRIAEFHNDAAAATPEAFIDNGGVVNSLAGSFRCSNSSSAILSGTAADGASSVATVLRSEASYTTDGAKLVSVRTNTSTEKAFVDKDGNYSNTALNGTAGSGTGITVNATSLAREFCHKITVTEAALSDADGEQDIVLWTVPAKTKITRVICDVTAAFTGGTIAAFTISVGPAGSETAYLDAGNAFAGAATYGDADSELGASLEGLQGHIPSWSGTTAIEARFTATGDTVAAATAGSATFYIEGVVYP